MDGEKILQKLVEAWCDQYHQEIISLEITKNEKKNIDKPAGPAISA